MKQHVTSDMFLEAFMGLRPENFSREGLFALYNWIEQYEDETDCETELDVIALCCEFSEYEDLEEIQNLYQNIKDMDDLKDRTSVIEFDGGIIIADF